MKAKDKLTPKQRMFVQEYLIDLNATQAAIRAGYSAKTAQEQSSHLLSKVIIKEAVAAAMEQREQRAIVTQDDVLRGLLKEALNEDDGASHAARISAWAHLGKHLGMFKEKIEIEHGISDDVLEKMAELEQQSRLQSERLAQKILERNGAQ